MFYFNYRILFFTHKKVFENIFFQGSLLAETRQTFFNFRLVVTHGFALSFRLNFILD